MNRHFKEIKEFKDYFISINGKIYSKKSNKYIKHNGKYAVLHKNGKKYIRSLNKLLSLTFDQQDNLIINSEEFKPILGFENYSIDKFGNIYSPFTGKFKKGFLNPYGYKCIFLSKDSKLYNRLVHRLVYEAWKGKIEDDLTIDHIDENKKNNNLNNLQTLTRSENVLKFHSLRSRDRNIEGFVKIENFDNYYVNKDGEVISFKYGEKSHKISHQNGDLFLRKDNKRYYMNLNYLLNKYFGKEFEKQKNRKYKNLD